MDINLVVYCTTCQMWFDTKNGWKANKASFGSGIPICPNCTGLLMQIEADKFYENNRAEGRLEEVMTWEWPNGSFWKKNDESVKELITVKKYDDYINDLTKEMDKHLLHPTPGLDWGTYLWYNFKEDGVAIRYPGATRGHIEYDKDKVITNVVIYDDTGTGKLGCYKDSVREAVNKFIGFKIVIQEASDVEEDKVQECSDNLPVENADKREVVIVGHGGQGRSKAAALLGAIGAFGGGSYIESVHDTYQNMKRAGFFPKPSRNVPEYARKNDQGRNEKCACGSGKKYKFCCGR